MALTIFLIGVVVALTILTIGAYHAYKCDMICLAFELVPNILGSGGRHETDLYFHLSHAGAVFTASEFREFVAKLIETNRIEVVPDWPRENDTFTLPGNWYRLTSKKTVVRPPRLYDHNTAEAAH